jgi:uncharacterized coiled-coil protein SlyX
LKKFITVLAVSTGGGILLGAGLRLGEKRRSSGGAAAVDENESSTKVTEDRISVFLRRLEVLERRIEFQAATRKEAAFSGSWQDNGHSGLQADISTRIESVEARLLRELERRNADSMDALRESMLQRINRRIEPLEAEIAMQRTSLSELGEYSIRTEKSMQRLMEGLERLVSAQASRANGTGPEEFANPNLRQ